MPRNLFHRSFFCCNLLAELEHDMPEVIINGPEGRLEGRYYPAKVPNSPIALLLHPHPQPWQCNSAMVVVKLC